VINSVNQCGGSWSDGDVNYHYLQHACVDHEDGKRDHLYGSCAFCWDVGCAAECVASACAMAGNSGIVADIIEDPEK
jgi:hypothetical protein